MNEEKNNISPLGNMDIPAIGDGEGEIPLAKQPTEKVEMRTMASDIASIQETGGTPRPYTPEKTSSQGTPIQGASKQQNETIPPGMVFPENTPTPPTAPKRKNTFLLVLSVIIFIGIVAGIYFFMLPSLNKNNAVSEDVSITQTQKKDEGSDSNTTKEEGAPTFNAEESSPQNSIPQAQENKNNEDQTLSATTPLPSGQVLEAHTSFFKNPADLVFDAKLSSFGLRDMTQIIKFETTTIPVFKEIVFKTNENKPVSFGYVVSRFFPSFFTADMTAKFESDGTIFSYTNTKGTWLGVIAKLRNGVPIGPIQDSMATLQKSPDLKNIFLTDPGTQGIWKDGKIAGKPASLVSFSQNGATLGYAWFDTYLLIGTNLDASNEAAKRLGY